MRLNPRDKLSKYFRFYEAVHSDTASRLSICNMPTDDSTVEALIYHAKTVLDPIREHFGPYSPTSMYRCEELEKSLCWNAYLRWCDNRKLKPSEAAWLLYFSRKSHPKGEAADIKIPGVSNLDLYNFIKENLVFDQLILEFVPENNPYAGWVHVSSIDETKQRKNRNQAFDIG